MELVLDALIYVTAWGHVLLAPYTKVEESFNVHATHDVLMYGVGDLRNYDHFIFPGAVPRTFVGSVLLAWLTGAAAQLADTMGFLSSKFDLQTIARLLLASIHAWTLSRIQRATKGRYGRITAIFFVLFTCSQFHYPFWMGRTIPNSFAAIPVNLARYCLLRHGKMRSVTRKYMYGAIALLIVASMIFRAEVALMLIPLYLQLLLDNKRDFYNSLKVGVVAGLFILAITVRVDSYFWKKQLLWPELSGVMFNVIQGKSAEWGTSPPLTYLNSYLPKLLLGALPLVILGLSFDPAIRSMLIGPLSFIGFLSFLGHKEWRFIIYAVPPLNIAAARQARSLYSLRKNGLIGWILALIPVGLVLINMPITFFLTQASMANYPGGEALTRFHQLYPVSTQPTPHVHISNLAAQTGATLFLQLNAPPYFKSGSSPEIQHEAWVYNKTENLSSEDLTAGPFTHLISEVDPSKDAILKTHWTTISSVSGFDKWNVNWALVKHDMSPRLLLRWRDVVHMEQSDKLWILERK